MLTLTLTDAQIDRLRAAREVLTDAERARLDGAPTLDGETESAAAERRHGLLAAMHRAAQLFFDAQEAVWREALGDQYDALAPLLT